MQIKELQDLFAQQPKEKPRQSRFTRSQQRAMAEAAANPTGILPYFAVDFKRSLTCNNHHSIAEASSEGEASSAADDAGPAVAEV